MEGPSFRDVTVLHGEDGAPWCQYLLRYFQKPTFDILIHTLDVDTLKSRNPPEIEASVRESYVVILLITLDLLNYMEAHREWFSAMLDKRDKDVTTILATTINVDYEDFNLVCMDNAYNHMAWQYKEILTDGSNSHELVMHVLEIVDTNAANHKNKLEIEHTSPRSSVCQMFPNTVKMSQDPIVIVFNEEIQGMVTLMFDDMHDDLVTPTQVNPYCVSFIPPVLTQGTHTVHVFVEDDEVDVLDLNYCNIEFTSLELMKQFFGAGSVEQLDNLLAAQYRKSICSDGQLKRLIELATEEQEYMEADCVYTTAMHWAAANGLKELTCQLLLSPFAVEVCKTKNSHGKTVADLAQEGGFHELKNYISDFIETKECADVCDLYVQACSTTTTTLPETALPASEPQGGSDDIYEDMSNQPALPLTRAPTLPPPTLPRRQRFKSVPETDKELQSAALALPTAHQSLQMKIAPFLKDGSVGCRSQNELIDIQEDVKAGTFSIGEAEMLFKAWKERYQTGQAASFRDKQNTLHEMRQKYKTTLSLLTKAKQQQPPTVPEEPTISEPIVPRKDSIASKSRRNEPRRSYDSLRGSGNSVTLRTSHDSGCVSDIEGRNSASENRKSLVNRYLELNTPSVPDDRPPLPPRANSTKKSTTTVYTKKKK